MAAIRLINTKRSWECPFGSHLNDVRPITLQTLLCIVCRQMTTSFEYDVPFFLIQTNRFYLTLMSKMTRNNFFLRFLYKSLLLLLLLINDFSIIYLFIYLLEVGSSYKTGIEVYKKEYN